MPKTMRLITNRLKLCWKHTYVYTFQYLPNFKFSFVQFLFGVPLLLCVVCNVVNSSHNASFKTAWGVICTIIGYMTSSLLMDIIGRKSTFTLGILPGLLSCFLISSKSAPLDILGRSLNSISFGATTILGLIIIGEYVSPKHRTMFLNMTTTSLYIGHSIGKVVSINMETTKILYACSALLITSLGITLTWPKSPYWLALKSFYEECERSFDWLRGTDEESRQEKKDLLSRRSFIPTTSLVEKAFDIFRTCGRSDFLKPATVIVFGVILVEASGRHYFIIFQDIVAMVLENNPSHNLYVTTVIAISSVFSTVLLGIVKNRKLLLLSGFASVIAMFLGSLYVLLSTFNLVSRSSSWICVILIILHIVFSNLGSTSIPISLIGEVFPLDCKAGGVFVAGVVTSLVSWAVINIASSLLTSFHDHGTLAIHGLLMTMSLLILSIILPETKGRTLLEIEEYFGDGCFVEDRGDDAEERLTHV